MMFAASSPMPKALCLISLGASLLIAVLFLVYAVMGFAGLGENAPLRAASMLMDLAFACFAAVLAYMSFATYREQR